MTTSSFSEASQLSSSDAISNASRSFCSAVSLSTHFALSNFAAGGGAAVVEVEMDAAVVVVVAVVDAVDF